MKIRTSSDVASSGMILDAPSAGRSDSRWIQAPIARAGFTTITPLIEMSGTYAKRPVLAFDSGTVRSDINELRFAAAASFFAFEDSLPENEVAAEEG